MVCLEKTDNNQSMCSSEIKAFQSCFANFRVQQDKLEEIKKKGVRPVGQRAKYVSNLPASIIVHIEVNFTLRLRLSGEQMNAYIKEFPRSRSKR